MEQRALALDHVPMIGRRVGREQLSSAGSEVWGNDCIERDAAARDHDPGLTGRAEVGSDTARTHRLGQCERGVLLAEGAVGADREQAFAAAAPPLPTGKFCLGRRTLTSATPRCVRLPPAPARLRAADACHSRRRGRRRSLRAARIPTRAESARRPVATPITSDPRRLGASSSGVMSGSPRSSFDSGSALLHADFARPVAQAARGLGVSLVSVADEQQVGFAQCENGGCSWRCNRQVRAPRNGPDAELTINERPASSITNRPFLVKNGSCPLVSGR